VTATYDLLAELPVSIERVRTERRELPVSNGFTRVTTTVVLEGRGYQGHGEDVIYDAEDHVEYPLPAVSGEWTLDGLARHLDGLALFTKPPLRESGLDYRRWAVESAALDLALGQAGTSLDAVLERPYRPVRFVVSTRHDPRLWLAVDPSLEFKLDPTTEWDRATAEAFALTGRVMVLDFKAYYTGTIVDQEPDPALYRMVAELFPGAVLEDPSLDSAAREALSGQDRRLSFDAPIHSLDDVDALPVAIRHLNVKPSRFGSLERLLRCIDACAERGVAMYGGGQFELGAGRGQIQALASLFYPDGPNDVAPGEYNALGPRAGLPASPLTPPSRPVGFSWDSAPEQLSAAR
jgi:hypothetical protein